MLHFINKHVVVVCQLTKYSSMKDPIIKEIYCLAIMPVKTESAFQIHKHILTHFQFGVIDIAFFLQMQTNTKTYNTINCNHKLFTSKLICNYINRKITVEIF